MITNDAWLLVGEKGLYSCDICSHDLGSIVCEHYLCWFHLKCTGLKKPPKAKHWFCRRCHENPCVEGWSLILAAIFHSQWTLLAVIFGVFSIICTIFVIVWLCCKTIVSSLPYGIYKHCWLWPCMCTYTRAQILLYAPWLALFLTVLLRVVRFPTLLCSTSGIRFSKAEF